MCLLAFAYKNLKKIPAYENFLQQLTFIGIIGFIDPAREDVKATITTYKNAGIRVVMMTGDHPGTAKKVAQDIGFIQTEKEHTNSDGALAGYEVKAIENERASVGVAGVIGVIGTAVVAGIGFKLIARKPKKAGN